MMSAFLSKSKRLAWGRPALVALMPLVAVLGLVLTGCSVSGPETKTKLAERPHVNEALESDDFGFPSEPPSLLKGRQVFAQQCASCHTAGSMQNGAVQKHLSMTTPIDLYLMLTKGKAPEVKRPSEVRPQLLPAEHPAFRTLTRDERWAVIFYARHLAGAGDMRFKNNKGEDLDVASIFGANCAVCHGKTGHGNGPLYTGHPSSHELAGAKIHGGLFQPPPANFHDYPRLYNRTDAQLVKYIKQGIYPSAMPAWAGLYDKDRDYYFSDELIWKLVRYVRTFAYKNDLPIEETAPAGPVPGLTIPVAQAGALLDITRPRTDVPMDSPDALKGKSVHGAGH